MILTHGAGAGIDSEFMQKVSSGVEAGGVEVRMFEFPYMQLIRSENRRRPPDRMPKLIEAFELQLDKILSDLQGTEKNIFIGGKSMGGRVASLVGASNKYNRSLSGVICLGFPFHPPKSPDKYRGEHLSDVLLPTCILQGERDTFGTRAEVDSYSYSDWVEIFYLNDGDHSFKPRVKSGYTMQDNYQATVSKMLEFINTHS